MAGHDWVRWNVCLSFWLTFLASIMYRRILSFKHSGTMLTNLLLNLSYRTRSNIWLRAGINMKHMDTVLMRQVTSLPLSKIQETEETCAGNMDNLKQNETNCCIILIFHFEKFLIYKAVKKIGDFESFSQIIFSKL